MTNPRSDSLPSIELKEHVKNLHTNFIKDWKKYPNLTPLAEKLYRGDQFDPNLESIENKFIHYQTKKEIITDFNYITHNWATLNKSEGTKNDSFYTGYLLVLLTIELYYLDALAQDLAITSEKKQQELKDVPINANEVAETMVLNYKHSLDKIVTNKSARLKYQLNQENSNLDEKIKAWNDQCKAIEEKYPIEETKSLKDKIKQLLEHEKIYSDQVLQIEALKNDHQKLLKLRSEQIKTHISLVDECILDCKQTIQPIQLAVDFSIIPEIQIKEKIIKALEHRKETILRENYSTPEQVELRGALNINSRELKTHLEKYNTDHQRYFASDKEAAKETYQQLMESIQFLEKSPALNVNLNEQKDACEELTDILLQIETRKEELKKLKESVSNNISNTISQGGVLTIQQEILESHRSELLSAKVPIIASIPVEAVESRRENLDRAWEEILMSREALELAENELSASNSDIQRRVRKHIDKNKAKMATIIPEPPQEPLASVEESNPLRESSPKVDDGIDLPTSSFSSSILTHENLDVLNTNVFPEKSLEVPKAPSYFSLFLEGLGLIYSKIKQFFSYCFSCFTCCRTEEKEALDELSVSGAADQPSKVNIPGSTTTFPFPISTSHDQGQSRDSIAPQPAVVSNSYTNTNSFNPRPPH